MAIVNRDLDPSQQVRIVYSNISSLATGVTSLIALAPNSCEVVAAGLKAYGLSGAPQYSLNILRATTAGPTLIPLGATLTMATSGLSAVVQGFSITLGATNFMQTGDVLILQSGVANTAAANVLLTTVLQPLQDVTTYFGAQIQSNAD